jgi:hypothetical protein
MCKAVSGHAQSEGRITGLHPHSVRLPELRESSIHSIAPCHGGGGAIKEFD